LSPSNTAAVELVVPRSMPTYRTRSTSTSAPTTRCCAAAARCGSAPSRSRTASATRACTPAPARAPPTSPPSPTAPRACPRACRRSAHRARPVARELRGRRPRDPHLGRASAPAAAAARCASTAATCSAPSSRAPATSTTSSRSSPPTRSSGTRCTSCSSTPSSAAACSPPPPTAPCPSRLHAELAPLLGLDEEGARTVCAALDRDWVRSLRAICEHTCDLSLRVLSGSYSQYQRASQRWWSGIEPRYLRETGPARRPPIYFVSRTRTRC
jgi:hypothetical protein